ncbi:uncharacterized protein E0L32_003001 [Thyridium curvatum]|uniref:Alpha-methylacyl-CoA racemase n=1 Tax=Thyridium curvatum TaxID=1093900 RepID=A0A507BME9_9PEZI|nr:uncharacterized protein E0L32_003001 [Thyridium curvatum]TPX17900.1 hypothetical protein E0L32_003001 [Thyridium curvatum]
MVVETPLSGLRVVELAGLAPVLRVDRPGQADSSDILTSYKSSITLDLKNKSCIGLLQSLLGQADVFIDPYRPGVLERLGLSPTTLLDANPRLIVVRITGYRRDGPYKDMAGHDINYLAVSGVLSMLGPNGQPPMPPANLLGDYAGGGLVAFAGVLLAVIHRGACGEGQVVEANMVDGASYIGTIPRLRQKEPVWNAPRGTNLLDGGCPYYRCYECQDDGSFVSVGALEGPFFTQLLKGLELSPDQVVQHGMRREDKAAWPFMEATLARRFKQKTRKEWERIFGGIDACVSPVLSNEELESAGYPQRPMVHLTKSASLPVDSPWKGRRLKAGDGGEAILRQWMGWKKGKEFDITNGIYVELGATQSKL